MSEPHGIVGSGLFWEPPVLPNDPIVVEVGDSPLTASTIRRRFDQAGLEIVLELLPVGPSRVGQLLSVRSATGADASVYWHEGRVAVPQSWDGKLAIWLGRPAEPEEHYAGSSDATAPGEPFEHDDLLGRTLAAARHGLHEYVVTLLAREPPGPTKPWRLMDAGDRFDAQVINGAEMTSATSLRLSLRPG